MFKASDINAEDFNDRFKLLMERFIARRLATDPGMVDRAKAYLHQERAKGIVDEFWWIDEWLKVLDQPIDQIRRDITRTSDKWKQLRIQSPLGLVCDLEFLRDRDWRRRAIQKSKQGLVLSRRSQYERMVSGPYQGDSIDPRTADLDSHEIRERLDLFLHRVVARAIATDGSIIEQYRLRLIEKANDPESSFDYEWIAKWLSVLSQPADQVRKVITARDEEWNWLRRKSFMPAFLDFGSESRIVLDRIYKKTRKGLMLRNLRVKNNLESENGPTPYSRRP